MAMAGASATFRTLIVFTAMFGIFAAIGWLLGEFALGGNWILGVSMFIVLAAAMNLVSYFFSDKIVLTTYRAKIVTEEEAPRVHKIVRNLSQMSGLPMPRIAIVPSNTPNAFATGRNKKHAVVAVTQGILNYLNDDELTGVLAHEMAHVKDRDIMVMSVAATLAGAISFVSRYFYWGTLFNGNNREGGAIIALVVAITAPIAAMILQLAVSRSREYKADYEGAMMIGRPMALANALRKLEAGNKSKPMDFGNPSSSSLFIVNPFSGKGLATLFSTHPPMDERIRRLEEMAGTAMY